MPQSVQSPPFDGTSAWFLALYLLAGCALAAATLATGGRKERAAAPEPVPRAKKPNVWRRFVRALARLPISPNQISVIGLVLVAANCALFVVAANAFWFGAGLIAALLFDTLDGQVAREQGRTSRFGAYLDAVIDRYQEVAIFLALGLVTREWLAVLLIATGSMLVSYNKARLAMEHPTANKAWPDLMERPLRVVCLCFGLLGERAFPGLLIFSLWVLAAATHFTAIQRFARAAFILHDADAAAARPEQMR